MPTTRTWKLAAAIPVALVGVSFLLDAIRPDCGYAGAPPCRSDALETWSSWTFVLGALGLAVVAGALVLHAMRKVAGPRRYPWLVLALALPWAYTAAWMADQMLNEDPCFDYPYEFEQDPPPDAETLDEKWPIRTNCRYPVPGGGTTFVQGDASVFYGVFGFWIVAAILLVAPGKWWARLLIAAVAWLAALAVVFQLEEL